MKFARFKKNVRVLPVIPFFSFKNCITMMQCVRLFHFFLVWKGIKVRSLYNILLHIDLHSLTNAADESISSINNLNIVNQLGMHKFSSDQVFLVGRLKGRELFSDQMNRDCVDLILGMCDRNFCTVESPRCLESAKNKTFQ